MRSSDQHSGELSIDTPRTSPGLPSSPISELMSLRARGSYGDRPVSSGRCRYRVERPTPSCRATEATVTPGSSSSRRARTTCSGVSPGGRPSRCPPARAAVRPSRAASASASWTNRASAAKTASTVWPSRPVMSSASSSDRRPTLRSRRPATRRMSSWTERVSCSRLGTTRISPGRRDARQAASSGLRAVRPPRQRSAWCSRRRQELPAAVRAVDCRTTWRIRPAFPSASPCLPPPS